MTSPFEFWEFLKICPRETMHFCLKYLQFLSYHLRYYIYMKEVKYIKYDIIFKPAKTILLKMIQHNVIEIEV